VDIAITKVPTAPTVRNPLRKEGEAFLLPAAAANIYKAVHFAVALIAKGEVFREHLPFSWAGSAARSSGW